MANPRSKNHPGVGACGLDCALCPRFYTEGASRCQGCGSEYSYASVGCKVFRCCVMEGELETCAECGDFPCPRFKGIDDSDSFVTHQRMMPNLLRIKEFGMEVFLKEQEERRELLVRMLDRFNDGRSRSLLCLAAALLPLEALRSSLDLADHRAEAAGSEGQDPKVRARYLKECLKERASGEGIVLALRKPAPSKKGR